MDHNILINDLLHRFPGYSFVETNVGDMFNVEFKDASLVVVSEYLRMSYVDCYHAIRNDVLNNFNPVYLSTTIQRDLLVDVKKGILILNLTTNRNEYFNSIGWISSAGEGVMSPVAYGNMYEDSPTGSAMDSTTKQWITASAGTFDGNGIVTYLNDSEGDQLVIGAGGDGDYMVVASCGHTNSGSNKTTMTVHIDGSESTVVKDDQNSSSTNHRALVANGILSLVAGNYLTMHIVDPETPANEIKVFDCHLTVQRVS